MSQMIGHFGDGPTGDALPRYHADLVMVTEIRVNHVRRGFWLLDPSKVSEDLVRIILGESLRNG